MNYISKSACNGFLPRHLTGQAFFDRNNLLVAMMRNRLAVRYICAPFGFGKTLLACSYANLVYGFEHTFWFDGANPCFLRDLDAQTLLPDLLAESAVGDLMVFDDVPDLGVARRKYAWKLFAGLANAGREVVVIATSVANPLRGHENECVCIYPEDLLYKDQDWDYLRSQGISQRLDVPAQHPVRNIPLLAEAQSDQLRMFLQEHVAEMAAAEHQALSFALCILEHGTFEDLSVLLGRDMHASDIHAERMRPFCLVDEASGEFAVLGFPLPEVLRAFTPYLGAIAREIGADDASELSLQCADFLLEHNRAERACRILTSISDPHGRSAWLLDHQETLLGMCALVAAENVYTSLRNERWRAQPALYTGSCIRRALVDYSDTSIDGLFAVAGKIDYPLEQRLRAAGFAYVLATDALQAADLHASMRAQSKSLKREATRLSGESAALWEFFSTSDITPLSLVGFCANLDSEVQGALALACCLRKARNDDATPERIEELKHYASSVFGAEAQAPPLASCVLLRRELNAWNIACKPEHYSASSVYTRCVHFEEELEVQQTSYARNKVARTGALSTLLHTHAASEGALRTRTQSAVPLLSVKLFGGLDVHIDNVRIDPQAFKRQKSRILLALLVLESGRDLSCENLAVRLWPDSSPYRALHNFYNCIYLVRKALSLADGTCPYVGRPKGVIQLDVNMVDSDAFALRQLCERMRSAEADPNLHYHLLEQMRKLYRGELLPSENDELMIISAREEWRNRIVNALLAASRKLMGSDGGEISLLMAEQALAYAPQREDCYEWLMEMQSRCGQRPAAVKTWMRYRTFLSEELGLDPSPRAAKLYERIINEEA